MDQIATISSIFNKEKDFRLELGFIVFHKHHALLEYFKKKWKSGRSDIIAAQKAITNSGDFFTAVYLDEKSSVSGLYHIASGVMDTSLMKFIFDHFDINSNLFYFGLKTFIIFNQWDMIEHCLSKENIRKVLSITTLPEVVADIVAKASLNGHVDILIKMKERSLMKPTSIGAGNGKNLIEEGVYQAIQGASVEAFQFYLEHFMSYIDFKSVLEEIVLSSAHTTSVISTRFVTAMLDDKNVVEHLKKVDWTHILMTLADNDFKSFQILVSNNVMQKELLTLEAYHFLFEDGLKRKDTWLCTFLFSELENFNKISSQGRLQYFPRVLELTKDPKNTRVTTMTRMFDDASAVEDLSKLPKTVTSEDIYSNQLLPFLIVKYVKRGNVKLFNLLMKQASIIDWSIDNADQSNKPMDYTKHRLHTGDMLDLSRIILQPPPLGSKDYTLLYSVPSVEMFTGFLIEKFVYFKNEDGTLDLTKFDQIASLLLHVLSFDGSYLNMKDLLNTAKKQNLHLTFGLSGYYMIEKNHLKTLETFFSEYYINQDYYNLLFQYACSVGNLEAINVLVYVTNKDKRVITNRQKHKNTDYRYFKIKKDFDYELATLEFHKSTDILEYFKATQYIADKIQMNLLNESLNRLKNDESTNYLKSKVKDKDKKWIVSAAKSFDDTFAKFMFENAENVTALIELAAPIYASNENLGMIQYLFERYQDSTMHYLPSIVTEASANGHLSILSYLQDKSYLQSLKDISNGINVAMSHGQVHAVNYFLSIPSNLNVIHALGNYLMTFENHISSLMIGFIVERIKDPSQLQQLNEWKLFLLKMRMLDTKSIQFIVNHEMLKTLVNPSYVRNWIFQGIQEKDFDKLKYLFSESTIMAHLSQKDLDFFKVKIEKSKSMKPALIHIYSDTLQKLHNSKNMALH